METMTFKTNAKCMGCLAKIEEILQDKMNREFGFVRFQSSPDCNVR